MVLWVEDRAKGTSSHPEKKKKENQEENGYSCPVSKEVTEKVLALSKFS